MKKPTLCQACGAELEAATRAWLEGKRRQGAGPVPVDPLDTFLQECCVIHPDYSVAPYDLYWEYKGWCDRVGERSFTSQAFQRRLKTRGIGYIDAIGQRVGIGLLEPRAIV